MTYERIRQMRLDHAGGCTVSPPKEKKVKIEEMGRMMERQVLESPDEIFRFSHINIVPTKKVLPNSSNMRPD